MIHLDPYITKTTFPGMFDNHPTMFGCFS